MSDNKNGIFNRLRQDASAIGAVPLFIIFNGLVVGALCFFLLRHETGGQKEFEARAATQEIARSVEQRVAEVEKQFRETAAAFAAGEDRKAALRRLTAVLAPNALLWTTEKGEYFQRDFIAREETAAYDPASGWPAYARLSRDAYNMRFNEAGFLRAPEWASVRGMELSALIEKVRTVSGDSEILAVLVNPAEIFGRGRAPLRDEVLRFTISEQGTRRIVFDDIAPAFMHAGDSLFTPVEVSYAVDLGGKAWSVDFVVRPTVMSRAVAASPWISFFGIVLFALLAAALTDRKRAHDRRIAEMSRTLAGAHSEIQAKTSERDQLFYALRKSEREYKAVINSVSDVIFETDETGRLVFLNETWSRVTGAEPAGFLGRGLFDLISPADRVRQHEMFDALVRGERQAYRTETHLELGGGDRARAVEVAFSMLRMTDDKNLRVVGTITDIEKRRRAEAAVREAEQRYRAIFENSVSGIYQVSPDGKFISANPALAETLGYATTEELVFAVEDVAHLYARREDRDAFIQKLLFEGRVSGVESEIIRKDGSRIWVMENARVVRSPKGNIMYYEGSMLDITERKAADEAMRNARLQAEIAARSRMEFLANMSHELRTPLNAVIGFSEIIKGEVMGPIGTPAYRDYAQDIYDSGNYLLKVISEILEVSKVETGNRELNQTNFPVARAVKACMTIMSSRIEQAEVNVDLDLPPSLPEILAEELGFKQILLNLLGNAIKFNGKGGRVRISAKVAENGEMAVEVSDTGIGMNEAEVAKALQPFGKVDNNFSTMKEGTGLGLTIVESLVRLHGGRFELVSRKGEGTTARVILPAYRVLRLSNVTPMKSQK